MNTAEIIEQLEEEKERLEAAITALHGRSPKIRRDGRRKMSADARRRISLAQKRRWKAQKAKAKA